MRLTKQELIFMTAVTRQRDPFGVFLSYPKKDEMSQYKEKVVRLLQTKNILGQDQKLTREGQALLMLWENYCTCKKHLIINQCLFAVNRDRRVTGLKKEKDEYEFFSMDSVVVLMAILKKNQFLRGADTKCSGDMERIEYDEWVSGLEQGIDEDLLILGDYRNKTPQKEEVYYWKDNLGYCYDLASGYRRQISPRTMRMRLMNYLEVRNL